MVLIVPSGVIVTVLPELPLLLVLPDELLPVDVVLLLSVDPALGALMKAGR
jgi:hypothetical protein